MSGIVAFEIHTMPPDRTTTALDDSGSEPRLTASEWAALERYHKQGYDPKWSQQAKVALTSALSKAYGKPGALRPEKGGVGSTLNIRQIRLGLF